MTKRAYTFILIAVIFAAATAVAICLYKINKPNPHVHSYTATVIPNTCEEDGYTIFACSCKDTYTVKGQLKKGHKFVNYSSNNDADYFKDGTKSATCENGCGKTDTQIDLGSKLKSQIVFNSLSFNDKVCELTVANSCDKFSFLTEITLVGDAEYKVFSDTALSQELDKVVNLSVGKNEFYIQVKVCGVVNVYTLCVARKHLYTVSFDLDCELTMPPIIVEEGEVLPNLTVPERVGYTFVGWNYDLTKPVTESFTLKATWIENVLPPDDDSESPEVGGESPENPPEIICANYAVEYYFENLSGNYALNETENVYGEDEVGKVVFAPQKTFEHFTVVDANVSGVIKQDSSTVLKVYYTRNAYTVQFNGISGQLVSGEETQIIKYGGSAVAPVYERAGYEFKGFSGAFNDVSCDMEVNAAWQLLVYDIKYTLNGGTNLSVNPFTYTIESQEITLGAPAYVDFEFLGWFDDSGNQVLKIEQGTIGDINLTARWKSEFFEIDGDTITGLTEKGAQLSVLTLISQLNGKQITRIASSAFENNVNITYVEIPKSITYIGSRAFKGCSNLEKVIFEEIEGWTCNGEFVSGSLIKTFKKFPAMLSTTYYGEWIRE